MNDFGQAEAAIGTTGTHFWHVSLGSVHWKTQAVETDLGDNLDDTGVNCPMINWKQNNEMRD
jgi:hypothetical protein